MAISKELYDTIRQIVDERMVILKEQLEEIKAVTKSAINGDKLVEDQTKTE